MIAHVGSIELFFETAGTGPPCVLVHGGPGVGQPGRLAQFAPLADLVRFIAYDHRGHGRSSRAPVATYTQDQLVEDLHGLCHVLEIDRPILLGTSAGGFISLLYAGRYPEALRALILVGTSASRGFMPRAAANMKRQGTAEMREAYRRLWDGSITNPTEFRHLFETIQPMYYYDKGCAPASLAEYTFDPETRRALISDYERYDARPGLANVRVPTFIGVGRHDWICPVEESEELVRLIPYAEFHIFEHSGHSPQIEETPAFMSAARKFLLTRVLET